MGADGNAHAYKARGRGLTPGGGTLVVLDTGYHHIGVGEM